MHATAVEADPSSNLSSQVADGETRAASHFVILQQHQQRKEIQEKKAAALQNR